MGDVTRLNKRDAEAIEKHIEREVQALGEPPTLATVKAMGYQETRLLNAVLDFIQAFGRIITLLVAELIQSVASLVLLIVFGLLEFWRIVHGVEALGQDTQIALLTAFALVLANVLHPIYSLRFVRGQEQRELQRPTLRGRLVGLSRWVFGKPTTTMVS